MPGDAGIFHLFQQPGRQLLAEGGLRSSFPEDHTDSWSVVDDCSGQVGTAAGIQNDQLRPLPRQDGRALRQVGRLAVEGSTAVASDDEKAGLCDVMGSIFSSAAKPCPSTPLIVIG